MLEQYLRNALGELTFQLCVANQRIDDLTKDLNELRKQSFQEKKEKDDVSN